MSDVTEVNHEQTSDRPLFTPVAVVASCVGFVLIGALQSLYGPAIPELRAEFGLAPSGAGLALSAHFIGGVAGVLIFNRIHGRVSNRTLLGLSYALMAIGCVGFATSPAWPVSLLAALITGLGFGGVDYGLNQLFAVGFGRRSGAYLNILNAHFGIGAIAGPALIGLFGGANYPALFLAFAVLSAVLLLFLRGVARHDAAATTEDTPGRAERSGLRAAAPVLTAFIVLYVLHVGVEAGIGGWEPTHLEAAGYSATFAASATSAYWLFFTAGRFLVAPLTLRVPESRIILVSCVGMAVCLAAAVVPALAPYAYAGAGLFMAPIFPTGLPWLNRVVPAARRAGAFVIAASMIGGVIAGPALGGAFEHLGVQAVPLVLLALTLGCLAATVWLTRRVRS
ncbi:MFS transporter [Actinoplanes sp. CA-252034]|uniref:MFS transporter n=1 Tax=Actinoplanes sp. CA-252034 TaxID=3239906 RepID=UPI003D971B7A